MKKKLLAAFLLTSLITAGSIHAQWTDISVPYSYNLTRGSFVDDNVGYVISSSAPLVFRTNNGGTTWDSLFLNTGLNAVDIDFVSANVGFVLADSASFHLLKSTTDGGNTWRTDSLPSADTYHMIRFTSSNVGYATGVFGAVWKTVNGGQNWTSLSLAGFSDANDKEYTGTDTILFTGFDGTFNYKGSVISSVDVGGSFQEHIMNTTQSSFGGTSFVNGSAGFAVFSVSFPNWKNYLCHTPDGGASWDTVYSDTTSNLYYNDLYLDNFAVGYVLASPSPYNTTDILSINGFSHTLDQNINGYLSRLYKGGNTLFAIGNVGKVVKIGLNIGLEPVASPLIGIYPNPTTGIINIPVKSTSVISIIVLNGNTVLEKIINPNEQLNLTGLANGMYIVRVKNESGIFSAKISLE